MDCSTPGFPIHHQLLELAQTYVHRVSDAIQPSHPLSSPSPPVFNLSQHQSLFQWVSSSHKVAKVLGASPSTSILPINIDWFPLGLTYLISLMSKGLSRIFPAPQFKSISSWVLCLLYGPISHPYMTTRKTIALTRQIFVGKVMSLLFIMLSRLVIVFLPRSNCLLISWLQ